MTDEEVEGLTDLDLIRAELERVADDLPTPGTGPDQSTSHLAPLGERAKTLYANLHHSLVGPTEVGPILAVRPLVELAIRVRWMSLDPEFHGLLYFADSEMAEVGRMEGIRERAEARGHTVPDLSAETATKEALRDAVKARLTAAGRNYGNRLAPPVSRMVEEVETAQPNHKDAIREAHVMAYQTFSQWEHTSAASFEVTGERTGPDTWEWRGDRSPFPVDQIEAIAASMFAFILETIFEALGDSANAATAKVVRTFITEVWGGPPPTAPAGEPEISAEDDTES